MLGTPGTVRMYQAAGSGSLFGQMAPTEDEILLHTTAAQTIHDALIDAGVDLERARSDSAVYYPDLVPQVARVATQPEVINAARSIHGRDVNPDGDAGGGAEIDACDVLGIILWITFLDTSSAPIL